MSKNSEVFSRSKHKVENPNITLAIKYLPRDTFSIPVLKPRKNEIDSELDERHDCLPKAGVSFQEKDDYKCNMSKCPILYLRKSLRILFVIWIFLKESMV